MLLNYQINVGNQSNISHNNTIYTFLSKKNIYLIKKIPSIPWKKVVAITVKQTYFFVLIKWMYFTYQMGVASWLRFTSYFWIWFFELFLDLEQSSWV
jgi:hypothetical protein